MPPKASTPARARKSSTSSAASTPSTAAAAAKSETKTPTRRKSSSSLRKSTGSKATSSTVAAAKKALRSQSVYVTYAAYAIAALFIVFGLLDFVSPKQGLSFFAIDYPLLPKQQASLDTLIYVVGARDVFIGAALIIALRYASRTVAGYILLAASTQPVLDGVATFVKQGSGYWNHWGYAWTLVLLGALLVGVLDK